MPDSCHYLLGVLAFVASLHVRRASRPLEHTPPPLHKLPQEASSWPDLRNGTPRKPLPPQGDMSTLVVRLVCSLVPCRIHHDNTTEAVNRPHHSRRERSDPRQSTTPLDWSATEYSVFLYSELVLISKTCQMPLARDTIVKILF